ncbi:MAG: hypothetical protein DHS20C15_28070 [Planctomycetota bacterium]|nr:MAG: hypothetical protein DHS20C15_28070 [Planctomycetota bacterium]
MPSGQGQYYPPDFERPVQSELGLYEGDDLPEPDTLLDADAGRASGPPTWKRA